MAQLEGLRDDTGEGDGDGDVERVLRARARSLAAHDDPGPTADTVVHLTAAVGDVTVAVPVQHVPHVIPVGQLTRLPGSGPAIVGLTAALDTLCPVADTAVLLGARRSPGTRDDRVVLVEDADDLLGLLVDRVDGLVLVDTGGVRPEEASPSAPRSILAGVTNDAWLILDIDAVLVDPRLWPPGSPPTPPRKAEA